jgi:hypothetical protein
MKLFDLLCGRWTRRQRAMALYQRAVAFANKHDHAAALANYTIVIQMTDAPSDIRAMALYNRSVVYSTKHDEVKAIHDLQQVLEMVGAASNVRQEAKRKLFRIEHASHRVERHPPPQAS